MKFGAIVVDGRNKIGGHVASKNRAGAYLRTKVTPVNGRTSFQQNARNIFGSLSQSWRSLTQFQRDSWNAGTSAYAKTDIFGDLRNPTGLALFQRLNNNLVQFGQDPFAMCPAPEGIFVNPAISLTYDRTGSVLTLKLLKATPEASIMKIAATPPLSAGKAFVKNEFRTLDYNSTDYSDGASIKTIYEAKFGSAYPSNTKIFVQVTVINTNTGQAGVPSEVFVIIPD